MQRSTFCRPVIQCFILLLLGILNNQQLHATNKITGKIDLNSKFEQIKQELDRANATITKLKGELTEIKNKTIEAYKYAEMARDKAADYAVEAEETYKITFTTALGKAQQFYRESFLDLRNFAFIAAGSVLSFLLLILISAYIFMVKYVLAVKVEQAIAVHTHKHLSHPTSLPPKL